MADDDYDPDALDEEGDHDDDRSWEPTKERVIALVDADRAMLETLAQEDEERSYISWPVQVVADVMGKRIKTSPNDEIGVVFYGTERRSESTEVRTFDHVYEYVKLDVPDAATIRKLQDFQDAEFQTSSGPGCGDGGATPGRAAEDLKDGLFACWDMLTRGGSSSSSSRVGKTILLFTNNQNPVSNAGANAAHLREQIIGRARELGALAVSLELIPLVQLSDPDAIDYSPVWRGLIALLLLLLLLQRANYRACQGAGCSPRIP
eukprot:GHUV01019819.1.p1 GENE.GHUV01019819.1~~GHUV01019819.1.p1  ORF type:complete len:263 (+),score=65.25 GHUV01019819.1:144-932(+)